MFGQIKLLVYLTVAVLGSGYLFLSFLRPERMSPIARMLPPMMAAILIAGYLVPSFYYLFAFLLVLPVALSRTRMDACVVFIVALLGVPSVDQTINIAGFYITAIDTTHVLALGLLLAMIVKPGRVGALRGNRFDLPFLLLLTIAILSQIRGLSWTAVIRVLQFETLGLAVPYYVMSRSIRNRQDIERLLLAIVLGGFVLSVMSVYEAVKSWPIYLTIDYRLVEMVGLGQNFKMRAGLMRTATSFHESTSFAGFLALALVATMAVRTAFRSRVRYLAIIGALLVGLLLTQSRGGWIAAVVAVAAYDLFLRNYSRLALRAAIGAVGGLLLIFAAQGSPRLSEAIGLSGASVTTGDYRVQLFRRGVEEIRRYPLFGNDIVDVTRRMEDLRQGENIVDFVNGYIFFGVTLGIPGILALFTLLASLAVVALMRRKPARRGEPPDRTGACVFAVACFFIVNAGTSGFGGRPVTFLLVVMAIASVYHLLGQPTMNAPTRTRARDRAGTLGPAQPA